MDKTGDTHPLRCVQYCMDMLTLVNRLHSQHLRVRGVEEIPLDLDTNGAPYLVKLSPADLAPYYTTPDTEDVFPI
jgi:hypothetical protein